MNTKFIGLIILMVSVTAIGGGGETSGNPDDRLKPVPINFEEILSKDEVANFFDRMKLPANIAAHLAFIEGPEGHISHFWTNYNLVEGEKVHQDIEVSATADVRYAESSEKNASITWYPAGLDREKEQIFLSYMHELARLSYTAKGENRGSSKDASLYVAGLDPLFETLLLSQSEEKKREARKNLERQFEVLPVTSLVKNAVRESFNTLTDGRLICPRFQINGRNFGDHSFPVYAGFSPDDQETLAFLKLRKFENSELKGYKILKSQLSGVFLDLVGVFASQECYKLFGQKFLGFSLKAENTFWGKESSDHRLTISFDETDQKWKVVLQRSGQTVNATIDQFNEFGDQGQFILLLDEVVGDDTFISLVGDFDRGKQPLLLPGNSSEVYVSSKSVKTYLGR